MTLTPNQEVTLTSGQETELFSTRFQRCRVTLTGISGEFTTIPFRTKTRGSVDSGLFEASEVKLKVLQTVPRATIFATTPEGVATLDIVFEVATKGDV